MNIHAPEFIPEADHNKIISGQNDVIVGQNKLITKLMDGNVDITKKYNQLREINNNLCLLQNDIVSLFEELLSENKSPTREALLSDILKKL
jgi:hypothetical protein